MSRTLQPSVKEEFYQHALSFAPFESYEMSGEDPVPCVLSALSLVLTRSCREEKLKVLEILTNVLLYDPDYVRRYAVEHNSQPGETPSGGESCGKPRLEEWDLMHHLTRCNDGCDGEAVIVGAAEVVKLVLNNETFEPGSEIESRVIAQFYDYNAHRFLVPLRRDDDHRGNAKSLFYTLEVLCFCVRQHPSKFKFFLMQRNVASLVMRKLDNRDKFLRLSCIRFLRAVISMKDDYVNKYLVKQNFFECILKSFDPSTDNLLSSAVIELVEYARVENIVVIVKYLAEGWRRDFAEWNLETFDKVVALHDANEENRRRSGEPIDNRTERERGGEDQRKFRGIEEEESYFDAADDDDDDDDDEIEIEMDGSVDEEEEEEEKVGNGDEDKGKREGEGIGTVTGVGGVGGGHIIIGSPGGYPAIGRQRLLASAELMVAKNIAQTEFERRSLKTTGAGIGEGMKGGKKILQNLFPYDDDDDDD